LRQFHSALWSWTMSFQAVDAGVTRSKDIGIDERGCA
jgi:hypothetical protein